MALEWQGKGASANQNTHGVEILRKSAGCGWVKVLVRMGKVRYAPFVTVIFK
jgi:hypothetical protein